MKNPIINISSDFGSGTRGIGAMEGIVLSICPNARVIHFCHEIDCFNIKQGAYIMEGVAWLPRGCHVCVVDPE